MEDCEDPDRVIVFDDLSNALFGVDQIQDRFRLLSRFLDFTDKCLSTSVMEQIDFHLVELWSSDFSLWWKVIEAFPDRDSLAAFDEVHLAQSDLDQLCTFVENVFIQTIELFDGDFRTALTLRYMRFKVTALLLQNHATDRRKRKPAEKEVRQFFKSLLKQEHNRSNLAVWEQYAHFEWEIGNYNDSRKVFETALAMAGPAVSGNCEFPVIHLYSTYAHRELGIRTPNTVGLFADRKSFASYNDQKVLVKRALRILAMAVNGYEAGTLGADVAPSEIVRARHFYQRQTEDLHTTFTAVDLTNTERLKRDGQSLVDWTACFALFQLLTIGLQSASSVLQNFESCIHRLSEVSAADVDLSTQKTSTDHSPKLENSTLSICRVLLQTVSRLHVQLAHFHLMSGAAPLNILRTALLDALSSFPDDVWLLKSFVDIELLTHVSGRLREYFHRAVMCANTPLPVLYAILAEKKRLLRLSTDGHVPCKLTAYFNLLI